MLCCVCLFAQFFLPPFSSFLFSLHSAYVFIFTSNLFYYLILHQSDLLSFQVKLARAAISVCTFIMDSFNTQDMAATLPEVQEPVSRLDQEAAILAREKGWVEPEKYDYARYAAPEKVVGDEAPVDVVPWASDARKYEWKEEYGDVGPSDEELEKMLFRNDLINRVGLKFDK